MVVKYLILGAGLSGLSAAYHLKKKGCDDWLILEKFETAGGLCRSIRCEDGFIFDQSIHVLYTSDPDTANLIKTLLADNLAIHRRESWVYSYGVYTPYPWQANIYGLPIEIVKECLMGVIKATYEKDGRPDCANFEEWCYATFGDGFARHFMLPYNKKLWAIDLKEMNYAWIKDRVMTPSLSEVVEGALGSRKKNFGPNAVFWYPKRDGIEALPKGFLSYLDKEKLCFRTEVAKVFWKEKRVIAVDGREWNYDRLISPLPLPTLIRLMEPSPPLPLVEAAGRLDYNTVYAINLAVNREDVSPYHWVYFPEEKYIFYRISFPKNFSKVMAPAGWSSIAVEVSASRYRQVPTGRELVQRAFTDLKDIGIVKNNDTIQIKSILVLNPAYIIYNHTHRMDVDTLHQFLRENRIYPCGRFGEWEYLNMDHSIISGRKVVENIYTE